MCLVKLVKVIHIFGLVILIQACGSVNHTDEALVEHAEAFEQEARERGVNVTAVPMIIVDSFSVKHAPGAAGLCVTRFNRHPHVEILREEFEMRSKSTIKAVVFHEQGHCALGLKHTESHEAIMNSSIPLTLNRALIDELFSK